MIGLDLISMESTHRSADPDWDKGKTYWHPGKAILGQYTDITVRLSHLVIDISLLIFLAFPTGNRGLVKKH